MTNVIAFPKAKRDTPPQTMEELLENVETTRKEHIEFVMDEMLSFMFQRVYDEGFDLGSDECFKTTACLVEATRAALYKSAGIYHPLHDFADQAFEIEEVVDQPVDIQDKTE